MSIYEELIERVYDGENFHIDFEKRNMKIGSDYLIKNGEYDTSRELLIEKGCSLKVILSMIDTMYELYKYSLPSERSDKKRRKYFKALPIEELTDKQLILASKREFMQAGLEGFILCSILTGDLYWDEEVMNGRWFYQSKKDPDLVILRSWIEN